MRTNGDEVASNVSDGVAKLTEKDVSASRIWPTVCFSHNDGWSVEE